MSSYFDVRLRVATPAGVKGRVIPASEIVLTDVDSATPALTFKVSLGQESSTLVAPFVVAVEYSSNGGAWESPRNDLFIVPGEDGDSADISRTAEFRAEGYFSWLARYCLQAWSASAKDGARRWVGPGDTAVSAGWVIRGMILEAQARGWGPHHTIDFDGTNDSSGSPWSADEKGKEEWELLIPLTRVLQQYSEQGLCEWWTEGTLLRVHRPGTGTDRKDQVKLGGPGFTRAPQRSTIDGMFTDLIVVPEKSPYWLYLPNTGALDTFGRLEASQTQSGVDNHTDATKNAQAALAAGKGLRRELSYEWTVTQGPRPYLDFNIGDTVTVLDRWDQWVQRRVIGTVLRKSEDVVTANVKVGDRLLSRAAKAARRNESVAIGGQIPGGTGTSVPVSGGTRKVDPAAPTGLTVDSNVGYFSDDGTARARVALSWDPVTETTDGAEVDVDLYEVWSRIPPATGATVAGVADYSIDVDTWESGVARKVAVRARSSQGVWGPLSAEIDVTPATPTDPPEPPSTPGLTASMGTVSAAWDGKLAGPSDPLPGFQYVYAEASATFAGTYTRVGQPLGRAGATVFPRDVGSTVWVRFRAVDVLGQVSDPSSSTSIVVTGVLGTDIDDAVTEWIEGIEGAANDAGSAAADAQAAADQAALEALAAAGLAGSKGKVWIQDTQPPSGTAYSWTAAANASESIETVEGVEVARNLVTNPSFETGSGTVEVRRNLHRNPSFATTATSAEGAGSATITVSSERAHSGTTSSKVVWISGSRGASLTSGGMALTDFQTNVVYTISAWVFWESGQKPTWNILTGSYNNVGLTVINNSLAIPDGALGSWHRISVTVSTNNTSATPGIRLYNTLTASGTYFVDSVLIEASPILGDYFDGSTSAGGDFTYAWTGTANASESVQNAVGVTGPWVNPDQATLWASPHAPARGSRVARYRLNSTGPISLPVTDHLPDTGSQHTLIMRVRPMTRALTAAPRIRAAAGPVQTFPVGVWTEARLTVNAGAGTVGQTGLVIASGSGHQIGDLVDIDVAALISGEYDGPYFDGAVTDDREYDLWIDTTGGANTPKRWNGSGWTAVTDKVATDAAELADEALQTANGKITTFYTASPPTADATGDLWIETDNGNKLYRWDGDSWEPIEDSRLQEALNAAGDAQATADEKVRTFAQTTAPGGMTADDVGDLWVDTDDGNKLYRWSGSTWVEVRDTGIQAAADAAADAQAAADDALDAASAAQAAADQAAMEALAAAGLAGSKGKVWTQDTQPPNGVVYNWLSTVDASVSIEGTGGTYTRKNLVPNPGRTSSTGIGSGGGTNSNPGSGAFDGGAHVRLTFASAKTVAANGDFILHGTNAWGGQTIAATAPVLPNTTYAASVWVRCSAATSVRLRPQSIQGSTGGTAPVSEVGGQSVSLTANTWTRLWVVFTTPASGMPAVRLDLDAGATGLSIPAGGTFDVAAYMLEEGSIPGSAFDGDTANTAVDTFVWDGTANNSPSTATLAVGRRNLILDPRATGTTLWAQVGGTPQTGSLDTTIVHEGTSANRRTVTSATTSGFGGRALASNVTLVEGEQISWSVWLYSSKAATFVPIVEKGHGTYANQTGPGVAVPAGVWTKMEATVTVNAAMASTGTYGFGAYASMGWSPGDFVVLDEAIAEYGPSVGAFFDGATPDEREYDLWIDTTGGANTPKRWNGSGWTAVTDKAATDAAAAAAAAHAAAAAAQASALNVLPNASFEQDFTSWDLESTPTISTAVFRSGAKSARFTGTTAIRSQTEVAVYEGQRWEVGAFFRSSGSVAAGGFRLNGWNGSAWTDVATDTTPGSLASWTRRTIDYTVAAGITKLRLRIAYAIGASEVWVDDVWMTDVSAVRAASAAASDAQATADGKNKVTYSTSAPSGTDFIENDLWFRHSGGVMIGHWVFTSGAWASRAIDGVVLTNLDAGTITTGFLNVAERIQAGAMSVSKLLVTSIENRVEDPSFEYQNGWTFQNTGANGTTSPRTGSRSFTCSSGTAAIVATQVAAFAVEAGERYRLGAWVRLVSGTSASNGVVLRAVYGTTEASTPTASADIAVTPNGTGTTYVPISGVWEVPVGAKWARIEIVRRDTAGGKTYIVDDVTTFKMAAGELIVDGTLKARHIDATEVWADSGWFGRINTQHFEVGARTPAASSANRVPAPLTDQAYWAAQIAGTQPRLYPALAIVATTAQTDGLQMANGTSVIPITTLLPVPLSRRVATEGAVSIAGPARFSIRWLNAAGSTVDTTHSGAMTEYIHVAPDTATHYVAYLSKFSTAQARVSRASVFEVIGNGLGAARAQIAPGGISLFDDIGDERIYLGTQRSNVLNIQERTTAGELVTVASISESGDAKFQTVAAREVEFAGTKLLGAMPDTTYNGQLVDTPYLERYPRGVIFSAGLGTDFSEGRLRLTGSVQYRGLGIGTVKFDPGRLYTVGFDSTFIRGWTGGSPSSSLLVEVFLGDGTQNVGTPNTTNGIHLRWPVIEGVNTGTERIATGLQDSIPFEMSGTKNIMVRLTNPGSRAFTFYNVDVEPRVLIKDVGPVLDASNAGSIATRAVSGNVTPVNTQPTTAYFDATWTRLFDSGGNLLGSGGSIYADGRMVQGGLNDLRFSYIGFGALGLSGKTITGMWIELQNRHAGAANAEIQFGDHGHSSAQSSRQPRTNAWTGYTARGERKRHPIPSSLWAGFAAGTYRGVTIGSGVGGGGGNANNYVIFDGFDTTNATGSGRFRPRLVISYR